MKTLNLQLDNLTPADADFVRGLVGLFSDPNLSSLLGELRRGIVSIRYGQEGKLRVVRPYSSSTVPGYRHD